LHIGNDEGLYRQWQEAARALVREHGAGSDKARWALEDMLREWLDAAIGELLEGVSGEPGLLLVDLLPRGDSICWREVAESILEGVGEEA
jgi:hypothetical protein